MPPSIRNKDFLPELNFRLSRSGGKGGQHVNKVESRVQLEFDVVASGLLTERQKARILERLHNRINNQNILQLTVEEERSQALNKKIAIERFYELLETALKRRKKRKPTKPTKASREKRIKKKKQKGEKKALRKRIK